MPSRVPHADSRGTAAGRSPAYAKVSCQERQTRPESGFGDGVADLRFFGRDRRRRQALARDGDKTVLRHILVKDYPVVLRLGADL